MLKYNDIYRTAMPFIFYYNKQNLSLTHIVSEFVSQQLSLWKPFKYSTQTLRKLP